ncbi:MAG: UDP-N-acetylmuramate dehydrogenase [Oceanospirillales bacterium]|nr:MAG: UDP-N-acetylmuramate dehydrogenase [Oceanospirillales bacterium]
MLKLQKNYSLNDLNTFGFDALAESFIEIDSRDLLVEVVEYCQSNNLPLLILGGGSNLILSDQISGLVARMLNKGIEIISQQGDQLQLKVAAGEGWHDTVVYAMSQGYFGLENLALIPGTVGAAPMQNIGAYGVELKDRVAWVEVLDTQTHQFLSLSSLDCQFSYRDSLFKSVEPGRYIITDVVFNLTRDATQLNLEYLALKDTCEALAKGSSITPYHVFDAVCQLRRQKLPDPAIIGNVGSFFKNPRVSVVEYERLKAEFPALVGFADGEGYKLAAGWLIEACGWKGKQLGAVGVYEKQALVLVNHGKGDRRQIETLAEQIRESVQQRFGVLLEVEPRFYP